MKQKFCQQQSLISCNNVLEINCKTPIMNSKSQPAPVVQRLGISLSLKKFLTP
jgi:hypothetical protein